MNRTLFAVAAIACLSNAQMSETEAFDDDTVLEHKHEQLMKSIRRFDGFRGAWIGFNRGLYKQSPGSDLEKECLNEDAREKWIEAQRVRLALDTDEGTDWITAMGDVMQVMANLVDCDFRDPVRDVMAFCSVEEPEESDEDIEAPESPCKVKTVIDNLTKNAFVLMAKGSEMAETFQEWPADNPEALKVQAMKIGEDLGTFVRSGLDFQSP